MTGKPYTRVYGGEPVEADLGAGRFNAIDMSKFWDDDGASREIGSEVETKTRAAISQNVKAAIYDYVMSAKLEIFAKDGQLKLACDMSPHEKVPLKPWADLTKTFIAAMEMADGDPDAAAEFWLGFRAFFEALDKEIKRRHNTVPLLHQSPKMLAPDVAPATADPAARRGRRLTGAPQP
jgi:hypothetical protein